MPADVSTPTPAAAPSAPAPSPAAPSGAGGFDAAVDAAFAPLEAKARGGDGPPALDTPGSSSDASAAQPEVETAQDQAAEVATDPVEAELEAAVPDPETPVDPYDMEVKPDSISKDGKRFFFNKGKAERLLEADKTVQQIREIDPGFSVDQYKEMATRTLELDRLLTDYGSGDPERVAQVAGEFVSPSQNPQSVSAFIDTAMANAAQHHPQAFAFVQNKILQSPIAQNKILQSQATALFDKYRQTGDPAAKALAQNLQWLAKGAPANAVAGVHFDDPDVAASAQPNPLAAERAQFEQERRNYQLQVNQDRQRGIQQSVQAAESSALASVDQAIDQALSVVPANVRTAKALEFKHAVRDLKDQFEDARKANPLYDRQYQTALAAVKANPTDQAKANLVAVTKRFADHVIGRAKRDVLSRFNESVVAPNAQLHQKLAESAKRVEPGAGNNTPVQRATISQKLREGKMTVNQYFDAIGR